MTILFESAIRVTLIAAVIALVLFAMRIKAASALHTVWAGVVVAMLLLPAWVAWGPRASIAVLPPERSLAIELLPPPSPAGLTETAPRPGSVPSPARDDGGYTLLTVYLLGAGVLLLRLAIGTIRANRLTSASCVVPVTVGLLNPRMILPVIAQVRVSRLRTVCTVAVCIGAAAILATGTLVRAQSNAKAEPGPQFEVETIKSTLLDYQGITGIGVDKDRLTLTHYTLKQMMKYAYVLHPDQIVGPDWIDQNRYDVVAKVPAGVGGGANIQRIVRKLMADRFGLKFHRETRQMSTYTLTVAKGGPRLRERKDGDGGPGHSLYFSGPRVPARKASMAELVRGLQEVVLDHPVIDETGLKGVYDFDLVWKPDETQFAGHGGKGTYAGSPNNPTIFTALHEQLGLELNVTKARIEVFVIDRAEKPTEN